MKKIYIAKEDLQKVYNDLKSQKLVAKHFSVSLKVIKRLVKEYKLGTFEHFAYIPPKEEILEVFQNGGRKKDVGEKFNVKNSTVTKWLTHYGISAVQSDYKHLTDNQRSVVIGSILGDGYLDGRVLYLSHSLKQEDYLNYKASFFGNDISSSYYRKTKEGYQSVRKRTKAFGDIKQLREMFYKGKTKIIPNNIKEMLNPLSIAIWYADDGSKGKGNWGKIATCCFTIEECQLLSNSLNEIIKIETYVQLECGYPMIRIPSKSFTKFCDYIKEFIPKSMSYKLSEKSLSTIHEIPRT
jgi:hypothetical protein